MELLLVVAILGILAAVVVVSVVGLLGKGQAESYATDERTIQSAAAAFYAGTHVYGSNGGWNEINSIDSVHNFPTRYGNASNLYLGDSVTIGKWQLREVWSAPDTEATTNEIKDAAIWMGLLTNAPGFGSSGNDTAPGDNNSPLVGEDGPYLNPLPDSCSRNNSSKGKGSYTWIVGAYGRVYGVFESDGVWYYGFGGRYP